MAPSGETLFVLPSLALLMVLCQSKIRGEISEQESDEHFFPKIPLLVS
jgi:hypothetical protein